MVVIARFADGFANQQFNIGRELQRRRRLGRGKLGDCRAAQRPTSSPAALRI
jgi:hypothetical protein